MIIFNNLKCAGKNRNRKFYFNYILNLSWKYTVKCIENVFG